MTIRTYTITATGFTPDPGPFAPKNAPRSRTTGYGLHWNDASGIEQTLDGFATSVDAFFGALDHHQDETGLQRGHGCNVTSWPEDIIDYVRERLA